VGLASCTGDDSIQATHAPPDDATTRKTAPSGEAGSRDDSDQATPQPDSAAVLDRCVGMMCGQLSNLPEQPELVFLEDVGDGWARLMEMDWEIAPGSEGYRCMTFTIPEDIYATAFAPQVPPGTHHLTFDVSDVQLRPDAVFQCDVGGFGEHKLQGGGIGSEPTELPEGVAMPLRAGQQVYMNLHLFNVGELPLHGRSGMWVKSVPASSVEQEAEVMLIGPLMLDIPPGHSKQTASCTVRADATVYGIWPHMHQTGVHARATRTGASGKTVIYDGDYDFNHQLWYRVDDVQLEAGDRVEVECTYDNDTDRPLRWGDSALEEMCFISLDLYPAIGYGADPCST